MKLPSNVRYWNRILVGLAGSAFGASALLGATNLPPKTVPAPPAYDFSVAPESPKSVFGMPRTPQEGRDPFFPNSPRLFANSTPKLATPTAVAPVAELVLKGISGPIHQRLAIINNRTFSAGETADVRTPNGMVRVRCLEIRDDSVVIQVSGERRELHLRTFARKD